MKSFLKLCAAGLVGAFLVNIVPALAAQVISQDLTVRGAATFQRSVTSQRVITAGSATAITSGGSTVTAFCATSTAGFCVYFGTGAPTISAAQGSIYLNAAGSSTSTRLYVNSTGSTTWVAITSAS